MTIKTETKLAPGVRLGPFTLRALIGSGGMGDVWLARHTCGAVDVAIKVIGAHITHQSELHEDFAREARAIAGLSHRGIVQVYDYGLLDGERPFLAMAYAPRGSLQRLLPAMDWGLARRILMHVCHALAHAHARGIVHKDLKPGNVLLTGERDVEVLLTDFGVAHALTGHVGAGDAHALEGPPLSPGAGTPAYMPPEQLTGQWRDFGPWTDLYALGCMAWEMITGEPPFEAPSLVQLATRHLFEELPRLSPRFDVPQEVEHWLRRLLRKHTWERYTSAAEAAYALSLIPEQPAPSWGVLEQLLDVDSQAWIETVKGFKTQGWLAHASTHERLGAHLQRLPAPLDTTGEFPSLKPPLPEDWREHEAHSAPVLANAGLGLFGLRELPLIGRHAERDLLWRELQRAHHGQLRVAWVRGPSGVGKSRLAEWLAVRAQEVGASLAMRLRHGPSPNPAEVIARSLAHHLQLVGLSHEECRERIHAALMRHATRHDREVVAQEAAALADMVHAATHGQRATLSEREQHAILRCVFARLAARREVILWIDDAQWGASSLRFLADLLAQPELRALPMLVLLTVRDDLLSERPLEAALIHELQDHACAHTLEVAPLDTQAHRTLVRELLGFEDELADRIVARTLGNPLFAVQLVGDWVERGLLVPSGAGFKLVEGANLTLPDDLHSLWRQRIGRLLAERFGGEPAMQARQALELAATLGLEVDEREWEAACLLAEIFPPPGLVEVLYQQRLARATPQGWGLVHGMLRESMERVARVAGRDASHHMACADMLRTLYGEHAMGHAERVATHLICAGRPQDALIPLIDATYHEQVSGRYAAAEATLSRYESLIRALSIPPDDLRACRGHIQRIWLGWTRGGRSEQLIAQVNELAALAEQRQWPEILGECWRWRGLVARFEEGAAESLVYLERARHCYAEVGDDEGQARCLLSMAVALRGMRALERAEQCLVQAVEFASRSDFFVLLPRCFGNLAEVSLQRGDLEQARERFERATQVAQDVGDRKALAFAIGGQGELALALGRPDEAAALWCQAETIFSAVGSSYARVARVNLAALFVARGAHEEGRRLLTRIFESGPLRDPMASAIAHISLAVCSARQGRWEEHEGWDASMDCALEALARTHEQRHTLALICATASRVARAAGQHERAQHAQALARLAPSLA